MEFEKEEFDGLMLPVHTIPMNIDILSKFPELKKYHDFTEYIDEKNKIIRYIAYLYDKKTPLVRIDNVASRKAEAAKLAGFEIKDGQYPENVEQMIHCKNPIVNAMIIRYLRLNNNHKFAMLSTTTELLYRNLQGQLNNDDAYTFKDAQAMEKEISRLAEDLTRGDTNSNLMSDLYQMIDLEELGLSPEDIAARVRDGLPGISYNPYR